MTWSYSRIRCFDDCPYRWYLQYVKCLEKTPMFYASYGSFMHKLLEGFYKGNYSKTEMLRKFLLDFKTEVQGNRPMASTVKKYIDDGASYLRNFEPINAEILGVEEHVNYEIEDIQFTGVIDIIARDDNGIFIVDHKSRKLKERSKRRKSTLSDEELDEMLKQLYLYASAVFQKHGEYPYKLCFNCFRNKTVIEEPFNITAYDASVKWAVDNVHRIEESVKFLPHPEFFMCKNICDMHDQCCYYEMQ